MPAVTMATPKRLNFSAYGDSDNSLQKHAAAEEDPMKMKKKKKKKKKNKSASPVIKRIWNEDDELTILKGLVDYRVKTRYDPNLDWNGFFDFVQGCIHVKFSKEQLFSKMRKMKRKFLVHMERINQGNDPLFTRSTDSQAFGYSNMIWGPQVASGRLQIENGEDAFKEDEHVNGNGAKKKPKIDGKSLHQGDGDDDLCLVHEAFETMVLQQGLSGYQKKLQIEKLMNLGTGKIKELSDEWKSICAEELELKIKKLRFSLKLVEAGIK